MSNVTLRSTNQVAERDFTPDEVKLIKDTVAKGATDTELRLFLYRCKNMELDPLKPGVVHFVKYGSNPGSMVIGIEGFRSKAARTGKLTGIKRGVIRDESGKCIGGWCEVFRADWQHSAREEVSLAEYTTGKAMWAKMPETMIKKVAEVAALRMAFADELGGVYAEEELERNPERDVRAKELTAKVQETDAAPEFEASEYYIEPETTKADAPGEYVVKVGKKHKNKKLKDIPVLEIDGYLAWFDEQEEPHADLVECAEKMRDYLASGEPA